MCTCEIGAGSSGCPQEGTHEGTIGEAQRPARVLERIYVHVDAYTSSTKYFLRVKAQYEVYRLSFSDKNIFTCCTIELLSACQ